MYEMASDDDDDIPRLSAETFAALQDFYVEKEKRQVILDNLKQDDKLKENIVFEEDWVIFIIVKRLINFNIRLILLTHFHMFF